MPFDEVNIGSLRTTGKFIESVDIIIRSTKRKCLEDPESEPLIMVRMRYMDYDVSRQAHHREYPGIRRKRLFRLNLETGEFTYQKVVHEFINGDEMLAQIRNKLATVEI